VFQLRFHEQRETAIVETIQSALTGLCSARETSTSIGDICKVSRLIPLSLLLACGIAQASGWVSLGKSDDRELETFIDVPSVLIAGPVRRAWFKASYAPDAQLDWAGSGKWVSHTMERQALNCVERTARMEAVSVYYTDGTVQVAPKEAFPRPWQAVESDTTDEARLRFICSWRK
jgi:hypothetical protein